MFNPRRNIGDDRSIPVVFTSDREMVRDLQFVAAARNEKHAAFHGGCINPRKVRLSWMPDLSGQSAASCVMLVRCRKCEPCLKHRAYTWSMKGLAEVRAAQRTWFATLTVRPEERFSAKMLAEHRLIENGMRLDEASSQYFGELTKVLGQEVTKFIKRVRKNSRAKIRYLLVVERHKDGFPHFHALIHEIRGSAPVTKAVLHAAWKSGFSSFKLVSSDDPKVVYYVTKYLTKSALTRIRASFRYGRDAQHRLTELVYAATRVISSANNATSLSDANRDP